MENTLIRIGITIGEPHSKVKKEPNLGLLAKKNTRGMGYTFHPDYEKSSIQRRTILSELHKKQQQIDFFSRFNKDVIQGYFFFKPMAVLDVIELKYFPVNN